MLFKGLTTSRCMFKSVILHSFSTHQMSEIWHLKSYQDFHMMLHVSTSKPRNNMMHLLSKSLQETSMFTNKVSKKLKELRRNNQSMEFKLFRLHDKAAIMRNLQV